MPPKAVATPATGPDVFLLTAPSATLTDLVYVGLVTDRGTPALRFTLGGATVTGLALTGACSSSHAIRVAVSQGATAVLTAGSFDAVSIEFTSGGSTYVFTPESPPTDAFAIAGGTVTQLGLEGTSMSFSRLVLHSPTTTVVSC